jgi:hypothetical protein
LIDPLEAPDNSCDIKEDMGQMSAGVEILLQMSHNVLTIAGEYVK